MQHPKDIEYFKEYPAPLMELFHSAHFTNINATDSFFGCMLYFLIRAFRCQKVLEIGSAEGYSAWYMANGVRDNSIRHNFKDVMYYGIDIIKIAEVEKILTDHCLPNTMLPIDTITLGKEVFEDTKFDLVFQDGCHEATHVFHEFKTLWPLLKGNGLGYWIMHDTRGPAEEGYKRILEYIKQENIDIQHINLDEGIYGLGMFRKMEGFDYSKKLWND